MKRYALHHRKHEHYENYSYIFGEKLKNISIFHHIADPLFQSFIRFLDKVHLCAGDHDEGKGLVNDPRHKAEKHGKKRYYYIQYGAAIGHH